MKRLITHIILMCLFLFFGLSGHASMRSFMLESQDVWLGNLNQEQAYPAYEEINITRTAKSPDFIALYFSFLVTRLECSKWLSTDRSRCQKYKEVQKSIIQRIDLDFKSAEKLRPGQQESFYINMQQTAISDLTFDLWGDCLSPGTNSYDIYAHDFLHKYPTLYFVKK